MSETNPANKLDSKCPESAEDTVVTTEDTVATTKGTVPATEDAVAAANDLLVTGKRHLLCGEVQNAVESLQESCKLLSEKYGEAADECGEVYFFYGKALLELSRMESGVLGNALDGIPIQEGEETKEEEGQVENPEKVPEDKREEISDQVIDAMFEEKSKEKETKEDAVNEEKKDDAVKETKEDAVEEETKEDAVKEETKDDATTNDVAKDETKEKKESSDKKEEDAKNSEMEEQMETTEAGTTDKKDEESKDENVEDEDEEDEDDNDDEDKENEEDISNIRLAWEMLDLARVIFLRQTTKEMQLKAAQAYLKLGEVGLELENYTQAISDFMDCLKIQKEHLESCDRLLAETHYQLGVAHSYNKQYKESREEFKKAMTVIEDKKATLKKIIDANQEKEKKEDDPATLAQQELDDLGEILPDIEAKIKDTEEEEEQMKQLCRDVMGGFGTSSTEATPIGVKKTEEKVNVLVPRKRKAEDETPAIEKDTKKTKQENGAGDAAVNGSNGTETTNGTNGKHIENGGNGMDTSEKPENTTKTVEDVKKMTEEAEASA